MQQTIFKECELIVCDDCSTDATLKQIYGSIGKNKNVIVKRHEKNVGMRQNFAEGINTASCNFIAYLDGDDYLIKNDKLEKDLNFLIEREDRNFVFSPALIEKDGILTNKIRDNYTRWKEEVSIKNDKLEKDLNFLNEKDDRNFVFSPALIEKDGILTKKNTR